VCQRTPIQIGKEFDENCHEKVEEILNSKTPHDGIKTQSSKKGICQCQINGKMTWMKD
jgi:hypothetical protein